jgi:hypothetical protein
MKITEIMNLKKSVKQIMKISYHLKNQELIYMMTAIIRISGAN